MGSPFKARQSPSTAAVLANRENAKKTGGRPKGKLNKEKIEAREQMRAVAHAVGEELVRLALHAKMEAVRAAACRDILAYAWGRPAPYDPDNPNGTGNTSVTIVNVVTGVHG